MKRKILLFSAFISFLAASAQTQTAQDIYAKATAPKANIEKIIKKEASKADSTSCHDLAMMFYQANDFAHAAACWDLARQKVVKFGKNYEKMLNFMALCYDETGDQHGIAHVMALMEEHNQHELTLPCDEPECMVDRAKYFAMTGDNAKAKEYFLKALNMPMTDEQKVLVYEAYADFQAEVREFALASVFNMMAANAKKAVEGETEDYIGMIYIAALYAYLGKEYEKSLGYFRQVIAFYVNHDSDVAPKKIAQCHKGMGNSLIAMKRYSKARNEYKLLLAYYEIYDKANDEYPNAIERIATAEKFNKEYDASIEHYKQAITIYLERGMSEKANEAQNSLNLCYTYAGKPINRREEVVDQAKMSHNERLDAIIEEETSNLELYSAYLGSSRYVGALATIASCYQEKEEYAQSIAYYIRFMEGFRDAIRDEFRMQDEAERTITWNEKRKYIESFMQMYCKLPKESDPDSLNVNYSSLAYDCMLLSKGILLNSSIEFAKIINDTNNPEIRKLYADSRLTFTELRKQKENFQIRTDSDYAKYLNYRQQLFDLNKTCAELADFTAYIGYDWHDVQSKLAKDDVAIEFASVEMGVFDDDNQMLAIVLTKDMKHPMTVPVSDLKTIKAMQADSSIYNARVAGQTVWGNLLPYIKDKRRIFFSADGAFNHIGIEYLLVDGTPLSEQKDVIRLSSTKELCYHSAPTKIEHAALFGDINYTEEGIFSSEAQRSVGTLRGAAQTSADGNIQFANLDGTRKELNEITTALHTAKVHNVQTFTNTQASEEAFRGLSDSKVNLLHIATHGAFLANGISTDAESMEQSILAFAGANLGNDGTATDGYITAADVTKMNLRNCQLAVLSACETALGKMGDDGVFGLQRGFKNAGVHTLLMSLRKVDDDATAELMTYFYQKLMAGHTPNESLRQAQHHIRQHGYNKPEYWASFIILDGNK